MAYKMKKGSPMQRNFNMDSSPLRNGDDNLLTKGAKKVWKGAKWVYKKNPFWVAGAVAVDDRDLPFAAKVLDAADDAYLFGAGKGVGKWIGESFANAPARATYPKPPESGVGTTSNLKLPPNTFPTTGE